MKVRAQSASKTDKTVSDTSIDKSEKREKILKEKILLRENEIKQLKEENDRLKFGGGESDRIQESAL